MSCVICMATDSIAFIAGDGRAKDLNSESIISENYRKVRRINQNVIVGFTGTDNVCVGALNCLPDDCSVLSISEIAEILCLNARRIHCETGLSGSIILAGVENGKIVLISFGRANNYQISKRVPDTEEILMDNLYPDNINNDIFSRLYRERNGLELNKIIKDTFHEVTSLSDTVNENITLLTVELPSEI